MCTRLERGDTTMPEKNVSRLAACRDGRLTEMVKQGDGEAFAELTSRYLAMIRAKISPFRGGTLETDDLCQEGLLGLLRAAQTFDPGNGASFRTYAGICVTNRVIMAYRAADGHRHDPMSNFVSLSGDDAPELPAEELAADPEASLDDREDFQAMCRRVEELLTPLEQRVLHLYLGGFSYREIARRLSVSEKSADNAMQRARFKLRHAEHSG